jgi:hypothetical protein
MNYPTTTTMTMPIKTFGLILALYSASASAQDSHPTFEGFYTQIGVGGLHRDPSNSVELSINGIVAPATISNSGAKNYLGSQAELGYNWRLSPDYLIGFGGAFLPMGGHYRSTSLNALGASFPFASGHTQCNLSVFIAPMIQLSEDSVVYGKLGFNRTVIREEALPDFSGYVAGVGYKRFFYASFYAFGELSYYASHSKAISKTINVRTGVVLDAKASAAPNFAAGLIGIGYQF